jgi:hemoglobin
MGGAPTVTAVANEVIDEAAHDPHLKRSFEDVDLRRVKDLLAEQICELAGGGCKYTGDTMHDVHAGLGITQAEFYGLVQVLRDSMRRHGVGLRERNELLRILAPMKRDVVEK